MNGKYLRWLEEEASIGSVAITLVVFGVMVLVLVVGKAVELGSKVCRLR